MENRLLAAHAFIECWRGVTASELATAQSFVMDLCELLGVPKPHATPAQDYMFERPVTFSHGGAEDIAAADTAATEAGDADDSGEASPAKAAPTQRPWPTGLTEQIKAVAEVLSSAGRSLDLDGVAAHFNGRGRWRDRLPTLLDTLTALGRTRLVEGRWVSAGV